MFSRSFLFIREDENKTNWCNFLFMAIAANRDYLNFSTSLSRRGRIGDRKKHHSLGLKSFGPLPAQESHRNCQSCCFVPQIHSSAPKLKNTRTSTKRSYEHCRIFASGRGENLHNQQWLPRRGRVQFMFMGLYQEQFKDWSAMRIVLGIKPCDHQASNRKHTIKKSWIHAIYELASVHVYAHGCFS